MDVVCPIMLGVLPVERLVRGAQRRRPGVRRWQLAHSRREAARTSAMTRARKRAALSGVAVDRVVSLHHPERTCTRFSRVAS